MPNRLESRGIPSDRFLFESVALPVPDKDEFFEGLNRTREFLKLEYPRYYWNPNFESYVPHKITMPKAGEHFPRVVAKGIYANAYYAGDRPLDGALKRFVAHIEEATLPSLVTVGVTIRLILATFCMSFCFLSSISPATSPTSSSVAGFR